MATKVALKKVALMQVALMKGALMATRTKHLLPLHGSRGRCRYVLLYNSTLYSMESRVLIAVDLPTSRYTHDYITGDVTARLYHRWYHSELSTADITAK
jgi:hypothetical protein